MQTITIEMTQNDVEKEQSDVAKLREKSNIGKLNMKNSLQKIIQHLNISVLGIAIVILSMFQSNKESCCTLITENHELNRKIKNQKLNVTANPKFSTQVSKSSSALNLDSVLQITAALFIVSIAIYYFYKEITENKRKKQLSNENRTIEQEKKSKKGRKKQKTKSKKASKKKSKKDIIVSKSKMELKTATKSKQNQNLQNKSQKQSSIRISKNIFDKYGTILASKKSIQTSPISKKTLQTLSIGKFCQLNMFKSENKAIEKPCLQFSNFPTKVPVEKSGKSRQMNMLPSTNSLPIKICFNANYESKLAVKSAKNRLENAILHVAGPLLKKDKSIQNKKLKISSLNSISVKRIPVQKAVPKEIVEKSKQTQIDSLSSTEKYCFTSKQLVKMRQILGKNFYRDESTLKKNVKSKQIALTNEGLKINSDEQLIKKKSSFVLQSKQIHSGFVYSVCNPFDKLFTIKSKKMGEKLKNSQIGEKCAPLFKSQLTNREIKWKINDSKINQQNYLTKFANSQADNNQSNLKW